jgi:hypothetical protein
MYLTKNEFCMLVNGIRKNQFYGEKLDTNLVFLNKVLFDLEPEPLSEPILCSTNSYLLDILKIGCNIMGSGITKLYREIVEEKETPEALYEKYKFSIATADYDLAKKQMFLKAAQGYIDIEKLDDKLYNRFYNCHITFEYLIDSPVFTVLNNFITNFFEEEYKIDLIFDFLNEVGCSQEGVITLDENGFEIEISSLEELYDYCNEGFITFYD